MYFTAVLIIPVNVLICLSWQQKIQTENLDLKKKVTMNKDDISSHYINLSRHYNNVVYSSNSDSGDKYKIVIQKQCTLAEKKKKKRLEIK